jgi:fructose-1,6-bisphosphatase
VVFVERRSSPLFGKEKMATFERYFLADPATHAEAKTRTMRCGTCRKRP